MRVACYTPLPPERSGIADYSYELLEELREHVDVVAVVSDLQRDRVRAPDGVELVAAADADLLEVDCNLYQMGNNSRYHRFFYNRALEEPGLLVMHDPSLADFTAELCGRAESSIFREEIAYDCPDITPDADLPLVEVGNGRKDLDRLRVLLARRIVEANVRTLVHSSAMAREMRRRYPTGDVQAIQLPAPLLEQPAWAGAHRPGEVVFGVFGGINYYKRVRPLVDAFLEVRALHPLARMVVAGRADDHLLERELRGIADRPGLDGALEVKTNLSLAELEHEMLACHVGISLRWPTAGEMSATLMRTFGAGRPAVVSDVLQFRELDDRFCWRVTTDFDDEHRALVELMDALAGDPERCQRAGALAAGFVEREATYRVVAEHYVEHLEHCARFRGRKRGSRRHLSLGATEVLGVNVVAPSAAREVGRAARRVADALRAAGVDVALVELPTASGRSVADAAPGDAGPGEVAPATGADAETASAGRPVDPLGRQRDEEAEAEQAWRALDLADRAVAALGPNRIDLCFVEIGDAERLGRLERVRRSRGRRIVPVVSPGIVPLTAGHRMLLELADAVLAPSAHAADVAQMSTLEPVHVVPWPVEEEQDRARREAGGPFRFVAVVEAGVPVARADPWSALAAFRRAFTPRERGVLAELVVVLEDAEARAEARDRLAAELGDLRGRLVADPDRAGLDEVVAGADAMVSLHRGEGFGLRLADAMASGLAVVATGYSGNLAYMDDTTACLVGYEVAPQATADLYLDPGWGELDERGRFWAVPDVAAAARALRRLATDPGLATRLGAAGAARVAEQLAPELVAGELVAVLREVAQRPVGRRGDRHARRRQAASGVGGAVQGRDG